MHERDPSGKRAVEYVNQKGKDDDRDGPLKSTKIQFDIVELIFNPLLWLFDFE